MKKLFFVIQVLLMTALLFGITSFAGVSCNMYITDGNSDSDYIQYSITYDTAEEYDTFFNWMKANNKLESESYAAYTDPYSATASYEFLADARLQDYDENGQRVDKDILFRFTVKDDGSRFVVTSSSAQVFFVANRIAAGETGPVNWTRMSDNTYRIR